MSSLAKVHIIAIAKRMSTSDEIEAYAHNGNEIYTYSAQWDLGLTWDYNIKIREIAMQVEKGALEWTDLTIQDGQEIQRQGNSIIVDGKAVIPFRRVSRENFGTISVVTSKIYNEFLKSREKGNAESRDFLADAFEEGFFSRQVADTIEADFQHILEVEDLTDFDRQIIVRVKIEGYKFIINFIKNILHSDLIDRVQLCEIFIGRVFMLESQNFIKIEL